MALAGEIMRYIGNEFVPMATKTASSSLSSLIPSAITKTGTSLAAKAGTAIIGGLVPKMATSSAFPDIVAKRSNSYSAPVRHIPVQQDNFVPLYHQTSANSLDDFSLDKRSAGLSDATMPEGIFLKETNADIGLPGKNQLQLDAKLNNPLKVINRDDLKAKLMAMNPKIDKDLRAENDIDNLYEKLSEEAQTAVDKAYEKMYYDKSEANKKAFAEAIEKMNGIIPEWREKIRQNAATSQKEIKKLLKENGYDGMIMDEDRGSFGRKVKSYLVLDKEQLRDNSVPVKFNKSSSKNLKPAAKLGKSLNPTNDPGIRYSEIAMANEGILDEKTERAIEIINQANNFGQPVENALYNKIDPSTLPKGYPELIKLLDSGTSSDNVIAKRVAEKIGTDDPTNADLDKVLDYLYAGDNLEKRVIKKSLEEKIKKFERDSKALGLDIDDPRDRMTKSEMYKLFGQVWNKAKKEEIDKIVQLSDGTDIMNALIDPSRRGIRTGTAGGLDTALSERLGIAPGNTIKIASDRYSDYGSPQSAGRYHKEFRDIAINSKGRGVEGQISTMAHERLHSFQNEAKSNKSGRYSKEVSDAYLELQKDLAPFLKSREDIAKRFGEDKIDYWVSNAEQEARMFQNYLENTGVTRGALSSTASGEWGDEIKPAFDKFVKTLQKLSKEGKALPAIAGLFGMGALAANSNKEKS